MIKLDRPSKPDILVNNEATWVEPLLDAVNKYGSYKLIPKDEKTKLTAYYRHDEIKGILFPSSHYKCAFCEGKPSENGNIEVEHFHPKSLYPEKIFSWENLLPACRKCNDSKLVHDTLSEPIVNPYDENPEEIFIYNDIRIKPANENPKADLTVTVCGLNSVRLMTPRAAILIDLNSFSQNLADAILDLEQIAGDRAKRNRLARISEGIEIMNRLAESDQRYAGFCRHYLKNSDIYLRAQQVINDVYTEEIQDN